MTHAADGASDNGAALGRLRDALQRVRRLCPDLPVLAIAWLHVKHPLHEVQVGLMRSADRPPSVGAWIRQAVTCLLYAAFLTGRVWCYRLRFHRQRAALLRVPFDLVAKSWCFGPTQPRGEDFYYGDLQPRLGRQGIRLLLLCGGAEHLRWERLVNRSLFAEQIFRIPEWCLVPLWAPMAMAGQQFRSWLRLRRLAKGLADPLEKRIAGRAGQACLARQVTRMGLYYWIGRQVARGWHPRAVIALYEGHEWEKCFWWGIKTADPGCRTVGYQHTVLFRESLAVTQPAIDVRERSVPDLVLCLGEIPRRLMQQAHEPFGVRLIPFGSVRYRPQQAEGVADRTRRTILVTPEGLPEEVDALFSFASRCAPQMPAHTFVFRTHPCFPMAQALQRLPTDVSRQPNIVVSESADIKEDFARSSILLYRGSSSVLYAILEGLKPIYLHSETLVDVDPLYALGTWRQACATPEEFARLLTAYEAADEGQVRADWQTGAQFVRDYTGPVNDQHVATLLEEVGLGGRI